MGLINTLSVSWYPITPHIPPMHVVSKSTLDMLSYWSVSQVKMSIICKKELFQCEIHRRYKDDIEPG